MQEANMFTRPVRCVGCGAYLKLKEGEVSEILKNHLEDCEVYGKKE